MAETITLKGVLGPTYNKRRMSRKGDYLFVCNRQNGLQIFYLPDKSDNSNYKFAANYQHDTGEFASWAEDIWIEGDYGYHTWWKFSDPEFDRLRYLTILDVTALPSVSEVSTLAFGIGFIDCVVKDRNYLYITTGDYLRIVDIAIPATPVEVGSVQLSSYGYTVTLHY